MKSVKCFLVSCCKLVERRKMHKRPLFAFNTLLTTWKAYVVTKGVTTSYCQCKAFIMSWNWVWGRGVGCHRLRVEGECEECNNNAFMISSATQMSFMFHCYCQRYDLEYAFAVWILIICYFKAENGHRLIDSLIWIKISVTNDEFHQLYILMKAFDLKRSE